MPTCTSGHDMRPKMDKIRLSLAPVNTNFWFNHKMWEIWHKKILTDSLSSTLTNYLYILLSHVFSQKFEMIQSDCKLDSITSQWLNAVVWHHITVSQTVVGQNICLRRIHRNWVTAYKHNCGYCTVCIESKFSCTPLYTCTQMGLMLLLWD